MLQKHKYPPGAEFKRVTCIYKNKPGSIKLVS